MFRTVTPIGKILTSLFRLLGRKLMYTDKPRCNECKAGMVQEGSYLYLLPSYFDDEHVEDLEYYFENGIPLTDSSQIPPGRRACYFNVFRCEECGNRRVSIADFLNVRGDELPKGIEECPYEKAKEFLMRTREL